MFVPSATQYIYTPMAQYSLLVLKVSAIKHQPTNLLLLISSLFVDEETHHFVVV